VTNSTNHFYQTRKSREAHNKSHLSCLSGIGRICVSAQTKKKKLRKSYRNIDY
jgi:hypothetical protein